MNELATRAGVSRSTVSHVLNGRDVELRINAATSARIWALAQENGYAQNALVRAVVTGKNKMLGLLASRPEGESVARRLGGVLDAAEAAGYTVKVLRVSDNRLDETIVKRCLELRLAGVMGIYLKSEDRNRLHEAMQRHGVPVAMLDNVFPIQCDVRVTSNEEAGLDLAVSHLHSLGHRRIAFMAAAHDTGVDVEREEAYRAAMKKHGIPARNAAVAYGQRRAEVISAEVNRLMAATRPPTAFVCVNDEAALAVMRALRAAGKEPGRQVSVVGYGNFSLAEWSDPALTSIEPPYHAIGESAVRLMLELIEQRGNESSKKEAPAGYREVRIEPRLIVRESTSPAG